MKELRSNESKNWQGESGKMRFCEMWVVSLWVTQEFVDDNFKIISTYFRGKKNHLGLLNTMVINCEGCGTPPISWNSQFTNYCGGIEENTAAAYLLFSRHLLSFIHLLETGELARWTFLFWPAIAVLLSNITFILCYIITYLQWKTMQYLLASCIDDLSLEIYK